MIDPAEGSISPVESEPPDSEIPSQESASTPKPKEFPPVVDSSEKAQEPSAPIKPPEAEVPVAEELSQIDLATVEAQKVSEEVPPPVQIHQSKEEPPPVRIQEVERSENNNPASNSLSKEALKEVRLRVVGQKKIARMSKLTSTAERKAA
jgi:hypothetical protein